MIAKNVIVESPARQMSIYGKFLAIWYKEIKAKNLYYVQDTCVFSHMAADHPCNSATCWSQMLFYLRFAPSRIRIIPKDIVNLLQEYMLLEPPAQSKLREIQTGIVRGSCPHIRIAHQACGHSERVFGCRICFPDTRIKPTKLTLTNSLPQLRPTADLIPRLAVYITNEYDDGIIRILADFILRNGLPHLALHLGQRANMLLVAILRERNHHHPDPHVKLLADII